eukprot:3464889-Heterocapsa_arctica.AAC.1
MVPAHGALLLQTKAIISRMLASGLYPEAAEAQPPMELDPPAQRNPPVAASPQVPATTGKFNRAVPRMP